MDGITNLMGRNLSKLWERAEDGGAWCAAVHGAAKGQTRLSDSTTKIFKILTKKLFMTQKKKSLQNFSGINLNNKTCFAFKTHHVQTLLLL